MTLESHWLENCIYYDSRVVIYERKMFCRIEHRFWNKKSQKLIQKLLFVLNKRCFHNSPRGCQIYFDYFFGKFVTNSCLKRWKENEKEASTEDRPFSINIWPPRPTCSKSVRPLRQNCLKNVSAPFFSLRHISKKFNIKKPKICPLWISFEKPFSAVEHILQKRLFAFFEKVVLCS